MECGDALACTHPWLPGPAPVMPTAPLTGQRPPARCAFPIQRLQSEKSSILRRGATRGRRAHVCDPPAAWVAWAFTTADRRERRGAHASGCKQQSARSWCCQGASCGWRARRHQEASTHPHLAPRDSKSTAAGSLQCHGEESRNAVDANAQMSFARCGTRRRCIIVSNPCVK